MIPLDLRRQLLLALASGELLAACGGAVATPPPAQADASTPAQADASTPQGDATAPQRPDATPPAPTCTDGRRESTCMTRAQLESMLRYPSRGGDTAIDGGPDPVATAPWDTNGCLPMDRVQNSCCNPAISGPTFDGTACCYAFCVGSCCGRPLLVDGGARVAMVTERRDWLAGPGASGGDTIDEAALDPATREALAAAWRDDARMEHASIASFARFTLQLLAVGAPPALVLESQRAAIDEIEHARLTFAIASRLSGRAVGPAELDVTGAMPTSSLAAAAAAATQEGCVGETLAALLAGEQARAATDAGVRAALETIASDEARHAELAWRFVGWAVRRGGVDVRAAVARAMEIALASLPLPASPPPGVDGSAWSAFGRLTDERARAVSLAGVRDVIEPCMRVMLA